MRRLMIPMILLLSLAAFPAHASPDRERPDNAQQRGRADVRIVDVDFSSSSRALLTRDRNGRVSLDVAGLTAAGSSECPRGRCRELDSRQLEMAFDRMSLDLQIVGLPDVPNLYEVNGRVGGTIRFAPEGDLLAVDDSRWHGTLSATAEFTRGENGLIELDNIIITGIAIDHVGAGIVMEDLPKLQIAIDHVGAG